jgi:hypothetical protein
VPGFPPHRAENCTLLSDSWGSLPGNLPHFSKRCLFFCHRFKICGRKSYTPRVPKKTVPGFLPPIKVLVVETRPPPLRICAFFVCCKKLGGSYSAISGRSTENVPSFRPRFQNMWSRIIHLERSEKTRAFFSITDRGLSRRKQDGAAKILRGLLQMKYSPRMRS